MNICKHSDYIRDGSFLQNLTCCLVLTRSRGWKRSVEQVPLKMFPITISNGWQGWSYRLIVLDSISTWVNLPGRPLSLGSAGTPPPSWSPVSFTVFLLDLVLYFFLDRDLCYSDTIVQWWWRSLQGLDSQYFKGFSVRTQVQVQEVGRSVLPGGPAAVKVLWSLHLKLWTGEGNKTRSTCTHSRALHRWAAPSRGSRRCGPAFSSLNVVLIILWDTPGTTCIL